jgi:beta-phosphoglucomutase-like phosphatase (HAD superfamily)
VYSEIWAMNESKAVLWDMDGTLVGSGELHWIAWRITMANEGIRHRTRAISFYIWPLAGEL